MKALNMKTLTLTLACLGLILPAIAAEGMHRMPDGTMMSDHGMHEAEGTTPAGALKAGAGTIVATVNGLVCDFCAQSVRKTLLKEPGVIDAKVDLTAKTVTVSLAKGAGIPKDRLGSLLKEAGYDMTGYKVE